MLDSSALLASILREEGWEQLERRISRTEDVRMGWPTFLECFMVLSNKGLPNPGATLQEAVDILGVNVVAFEPSQGATALYAFETYGKGRHPAALNFGDCLTYGLAKAEGKSLLYIGDDFSKTDLSKA